MWIVVAVLRRVWRAFVPVRVLLPMLPLRIVPVWVVGVLLLRMFRRLRRARRVFRFLFLRFAIALFVALGIGALFSSRRFFSGFSDCGLQECLLFLFILKVDSFVDKGVY